MAVYEKTYRRYEGRLTPRKSRFLVLARYAKTEVFSARITTALFALSFAVPLGAAVLVYLHHNAGALQLMDLRPQDVLPIDEQFFFVLTSIQGFFAFLLTVLVAPGLVSPDLAHNALPLYLARPFSRTEYVAGKMTVLLVLLSLVTWVPLLLLFFLQVELEGASWTADYGHVGWAIFAGSAIWVLVLSLLGLAFSAWAKWRTAAAGLLFAVFFVGQALSVVVNEMFDTRWGSILHLGELIKTVWSGLFYLQTTPGLLPVPAAWVALALLCGFCLLLLNRRLKAYEVVR
jgi:ABC-2 type transport system permease protein